MQKEKVTKATFTKSARVISNYENDMIFEQPRDNLIRQEFISYEVISAGGVNCLRRTITTRTYEKAGGYNDTTSVIILG